MTEEELKKIESPSVKKSKGKPLTERAKKRNTIFLQLGGAALLFVFAFVLVPVSIIGTKYLYALRFGLDSEGYCNVPPSSLVLSIIMFVAIVLAWFLSRQVCKLIVKHLGAEKLGDMTYEFYLGKK